MHGSSPGGFALVANAEVDSMGGVVDCGGVDIDNKTSPRRAAIEKAQTELRQEYDAREERKRELEFLEKGGNPLDFKLSLGASISLQSTSFTDQQAEQYVISEAKGSFALAASPHGDGDSVESSGRPVGGSVGREPNIADNLLLFEGENSNPDGAKNMKRTGKRGNAAMLEQSSVLDRRNNTKETDDSLVSRHGVKSQAYARRNRSRPSHSNKSLTPSSFPGPKNEKGLLREAPAEDHAISSLSNSKPVSPNFTSDNHLDMELDGRKIHHASTNMVKDRVQDGETEVGISETVRDTNHSNLHIDAKSKQVASCTDPGSSDVTGKGEATGLGFLLAPQESTENFKDISSNKRNSGLGIPDKVATDAHSSDLSRKTNAVGGVSEVLSLDNVKNDTDCTGNMDSVGIADNANFATINMVNGSSNGEAKELTVFQGASDNNELRRASQSIRVNAPIIGADEPRFSHSNLNKSAVQIKDEVELCDNITEASNEIRLLQKNESVKPNGESVSKSERKPSNSLGDSSHSTNRAAVITSTSVLPTCEPSEMILCKRGVTATSAVQNCAASNLKLAKECEDTILKEARTIEANLKWAGELPMCYMSLERKTKCHWDFVLEEMAWMANDFMQERLWKRAVAAHVSHQIASNSRTKYEQEIICQKQRSIARTLAISVMKFWQFADLSQTAMEASSGVNGDCTTDLFESCKVNGTKAEQNEGSKYLKSENPCVRPAIQAYAVRFLKYDKDTVNLPVLAEAPTTPDRYDAGVLEISWDDQLSEESLFYTVPPGAMQAYREAMESQWLNKRVSNSVHPEDCDTSICDSIPDGPRDYVYEEDEGETGPYFLPGSVEGGLSSKLTHKKRKHLHQKSYAARLYDAGSDLSYDPCLEGTSANQAPVFVARRPSSSLNVGSIPTKRVRTAARQRLVSPFSAGITGSLQVTSKTDVSSGDTNSFQDDQSSMFGGSQSRKNMEVESTMDFEKHLPSDSTEISTKFKKKKKPKHVGYTMNLTDPGVLAVSGKGSLLDQRLQVDSMVQHEQRDHGKRRLESQHFEPNGNIGIYGQHVAKKPKLLKQLTETSPDAIMPATGSLPSPAASQMSNMPSQNKLIKIIANRDRGRKGKAMKVAIGQSGSGIPWTNFEDQALVVLVHDMGPNWELVSDAINSALQFKCIFRKPKDCKERHKYLMDKSAGDGGDSAEDSGSSQPYPSTLPGIPKGSARQLFQHLQGPIVEDVLRTHFEKIIQIGQQLHLRKSQNDKQELKQIIPVHSSHVVLSQACPNNLAGGVLTPLDLCDAAASSSDVLGLGYQGSHTSGSAIPGHQGSVSPVLSTSGVNTLMQGSSGVVLGSNLPSPSAPINVPARDSQRYCMPRTTSLPVDDPQRMQYNQMLSGRKVQQSSMSAPGSLPVGVDRGVRMLPGSNGVGMMGGRNMPMTRPGFQGLSPPGMLNMVSTGSMLAGSGVGNVHPSTVSTPANSMMRPREAVQMLRPSQNTEDHRQMMMQDLQMQVSQGNAQAVPPFNGISAPFSTATGIPSVQPYPAQQHQQSHQMPQQPHMLGNPHHPHIQGTTNQTSAQQQAYAIRFAKERQHQQRMMSQSTQPYSGSSTMSSMQNNSQLQQQSQASSSVSPAPPPQVQHNKQQMPRNTQSSSGMSNQMMKQRQRPQIPQQQQPRQHQQKQLMHQQAKHIKGLGRGSMIGHPNLPVDPSQVNGLSVATRNPVSEKPVMQQGQGFFPATSGLNPTLTQSSNHNKMFIRPPSQSSKQMPQLPSISDTCNQGPLQISTNNTLSAPQQPPLSTSLPLSNVPLQQQQQQRQMNPNMQRMMLTQNRPLTSDGKIQAPADQVNQMVPASLPRCADSTSSPSVASSAAQWKPEPLYDTNTQAPPAHLASSPQESLVGTDSSVPPSSEELAQRQFSGSVLPHGHSVGGQWQQQHQSQQQQQQQKQQSQHRQTSQGNSYALPSNSGPG